MLTIILYMPKDSREKLSQILTLLKKFSHLCFAVSMYTHYHSTLKDNDFYKCHFNMQSLKLTTHRTPSMQTIKFNRVTEKLIILHSFAFLSEIHGYLKIFQGTGVFLARSKKSF